MSVSYDTPPEGVRRPARPVRRARIRVGEQGDFGVAIWVRTQAEAEAIVQLIDDFLRKPEAGASEP